MIDPVLALNNYVVAALVVAFLFVSVIMILVVLVQRPQGGGLAGAFGGGGGAGQTAFGARTGDALTIATITIFVVYLLCAIVLNYTIQPPRAEFAPATIQGADQTGTTPASTQSEIVIPTPVPAEPAPADTGEVGPQAPEAQPQAEEPGAAPPAAGEPEPAAEEPTPPGGGR